VSTWVLHASTQACGNHLDDCDTNHLLTSLTPSFLVALPIHLQSIIPSTIEHPQNTTMASTLDSLDWENLDIATSSLSELDSLSAHIKSQQESLYLLVDKLQEVQIKIVPMYHEILHDLDNGIKHFEGPVTPALANNAALMRFRQHWPQLKTMFLVNLDAFEESRFAFVEFIDKCGIARE
jgi:hypothetical protein